MNWSEEYSLEIPEIDREHQSIFAAVAALRNTLRQKSRWPEVHAGLIEMSDLTLNHFEVEESLMQIHSFGGIQEHSNHHRRFSARIQGLLKMSLTRSITEVDLAFLDEWWVEHIFLHDRAYAEWFHKAGAAAVINKRPL